jgi:hypothetical protein
MRARHFLAFLVGSVVLAAVAALGAGAAQPQDYTFPWLRAYDPAQSIESRIPAPSGFDRLTVSSGSFGDWLRHLPLKPGNPDVLLFNGQKRVDQASHYAVVDIDVGNQDLQQCADAVIRLRAEYFYSRNRYEDIHFLYTNGATVDFQQWIDGKRPQLRNNVVEWVKSEPPDWSYSSFRKYLNNIFLYAGSISLDRELVPVKAPSTAKMGDVFITPGRPGHAVLVVDMACEMSTGRKVVLLAQSFIPAQDIHILKNMRDTKLSPWYDANFGGVLITPDWRFGPAELKRFPGE